LQDKFAICLSCVSIPVNYLLESQLVKLYAAFPGSLSFLQKQESIVS
jgi:hypothetical protein